MTDDTTKGAGESPSAALESDDGMVNGAVFVIDALGFTGIWQRYRARDVIATLTHARSIADDGNKGLNTAERFGVKVEMSFFSDTVIITAVPLPAAKTEPTPLTHLLAAGSFAIGFIRAAVYSTPPLVYRGCGTFGPLRRDGDFIVGRAMDAASKWYQSANAAAIWLMAPRNLSTRMRHLVS